MIQRIPISVLFILFLVACADKASEVANGPDDGLISAEAGANQVVLVNSQINLVSSASIIPDGFSVGYQWSVLNRPNNSGAQIENPQSSLANFTPDQAGEYLLQLSIIYNQRSYTDTMILTVLSQQGNGLGQLAGTVDSSLVNRWGGNKVYVYSGNNVVPDDLGGSGAQPIQVVEVQQSDSQCRFNYQVLNLADGQYTVAFTKEGEQDNPTVDDTLNFSSLHSLNINSGGQPQSFDFPAASVIQVGPTRTYKTLMDAYTVAGDGDVIEVDNATYTDNIVVWRQNNLTIRGVGGRPHLTLSGVIPYAGGSDLQNGKGIFVTRGRNIRIENLEFSNAAVTDENGAAIRIEGPDLTICNAYIHDGENGILGGGGHLLVEYTEFYNNGFGFGQTHNIYVDTNGSFTFRHSYSHGAKIGHNLKSRAANNYILYSRIMDEDTGTASYQLDFPNGGIAYLIGNVIQQGPQNDNSTIISFGAEGLRAGPSELYAAHNTIVNDHGGGSFFYMRSGSIGEAINNIFIGPGAPSDTGAGNFIRNNNYSSTSDALVSFANRGAFDYQINGDSMARDQGIDPGSVNGVSLLPVYQYVNEAKRQTRDINNIIDQGAFEF